jgi:hypothetical protein
MEEGQENEVTITELVFDWCGAAKTQATRVQKSHKVLHRYCFYIHFQSGLKVQSVLMEEGNGIVLEPLNANAEDNR